MADDPRRGSNHAPPEYFDTLRAALVVA